MSAMLRLRAQCLNFWEVLAQTIALISPTMTAALLVPLMYSRAGNATWVAYAVTTLMLLFVTVNVNVFARRSSHTGSMFLYSVAGLGTTGGALTGWCLIWAYVFIGAAGITGFTIFAQQLLRAVGIHAPAIALFAVCGLTSWYLAYRDIAVSTIVMLAVEAISLALIVVLAVVALGRHGFALDRNQLTLKGSSISQLGLGVAFALFGLDGFESATAFGEEAKSPLQMIPRAIIASLLISGAFLVFISYVEIQGLRDANAPLGSLTSPLTELAAAVHADILAAPINIAVMSCFFLLALSSMNAGARIIYQMGRKGFLPGPFGRVHPSHRTPCQAVLTVAMLQFAIPTGMTLCSVAAADALNAAVTFSALGFLGAYGFISLAGPMYLHKIGALRARDVAYSAVALAFLLIPAVASFYPAPAAPLNGLPYLFLAYFLAGLFVFVARREQTKGFASRSLAEDASLMAVDEPAIA